MKKVLSFLIFMVSAFVFAGHHFESDLAKKYPQMDLTDVFVFKSATPNKTVFIMAFNPNSQKNSLDNYSDKGIYRFCIGSDKDFTSGISPTFTFKNQKIQFYLPNVPDPVIYKTGDLMAEGPIDRILELSNGIKIFTGSVLDLFQGNSSGIHGFKESASKGVFDLKAFDIGEKGNIFKELTSTVIVLELPNELLPKNIYYYATTAVEMDHGHWHRVNRISHVLFPHLYLLDKDKMNTYIESNHKVDEGIKAAVYNNILHYTTIAPYQKDAVSFAKKMTDYVYPDVISYEVGTDAEYSVSKINGRPLQADAMNVALALLVGSNEPIDDQVAIKFERFQDVFPYVVPIDDSYVNATDKVVKIDVVSAEDVEHILEDGSAQQNTKRNLIWYVLFGLGAVLILFGLFSKRK